MENKLIKAFSQDVNIDEKSLAYICKALEKHNQPGFDYLEAKLAMVDMHLLGMEETMAIRSTFASASAMGVSKQAILESVEAYKIILMQEREAFDKALANAMHRNVEARLQECRQLETRSKEIEQEVARLQVELETIQKSIAVSQEAIASASGDLERSEQAFKKTFDHVIGTMEQDKVRMEGI